MRALASLGVGAMLTVMVVASVPAAPPKCATVKEIEAVNARVLQTELMVAGLSCSQAEQYNQFVGAFERQLLNHEQALKNLFERTYGGASRRELNDFVTKLANDSSTRSQKIGYGYCYFTWDLFMEALATQPADFEKLTSKPWIVRRHGFEACGRS